MNGVAKIIKPLMLASPVVLFAMVSHAQVASLDSQQTTGSVSDPQALTLEANEGAQGENPLAQPFDVQFAAAFEELLSTTSKKGGAAGRISKELKEIYGEAAYLPVLTSEDGFTVSARRMIFRLHKADADGLNPQDYNIPPLSFSVTPQNAADAELNLLVSAIRYAEHAKAGRLDPKKVHKNLDLKPQKPKVADIARALLDTQDRVAVLDSYHPLHAEYKRLRTKLAELNAQTDIDRPEPVPFGRLLKAGVVDDRVPALRRRLGIVEGPDPELFDEEVETAVREFQRERGLQVDGMAGRQTLGALNTASFDPRNDIIANMERWRWLPQELGQFHVKVNIPEFKVRIFDNNQVFHETKVVVGKVRHQTPIFSDKMEHIVVNPYWNVPLSILVNEMMPEARYNPYYFDDKGYEVLQNGRRIRASRIDWDYVDPAKLHVRQPPGSGNALGQVKFMFPNKHAVYLHDTPSKSLFDKITRTYSHGCIRVHEPLEFARALLSRDPNLTMARVYDELGGQEQQLNLAQHIPVHLTYFTIRVDEAGELHRYTDAYGHNGRVKKALGMPVSDDEKNLIATADYQLAAGRKPRQPSAQERQPRRPRYECREHFFGRIFCRRRNS